MFRLGRFVAILFCLAVAFVTTAELASATAQSFNVPAGTATTRTLSLAVEDRIVIKFTVTGGPDDNTIAFSIDYSNGTTSAFGKLGFLTHSFVCDKDGTCVLHFSNVGSSIDKLVTLDYEVQHYIFGMPQMLFLAMVVAVICVAMVAVFVLMAKPR